MHRSTHVTRLYNGSKDELTFALQHAVKTLVGEMMTEMTQRQQVNYVATWAHHVEVRKNQFAEGTYKQLVVRITASSTDEVNSQGKSESDTPMFTIKRKQ